VPHSTLSCCVHDSATAAPCITGELQTAVAALTLEPWIEAAVAPEPQQQQQQQQQQPLQAQTLQQLPLAVLPAAATASATATPANTPLQHPRHLSSSGVAGSGSIGSGGGAGSSSSHQQQRRKLNTALFSSPPLAPRGSAATRERPPSPCAFSLSIGAGESVYCDSAHTRVRAAHTAQRSSHVCIHS
jgi:hypothetical protein